MSKLTPEEKSKFFVERTKDLWPANWDGYLELIKHETWTKEELAAYNFQKRVEMLQYAYEHTAFYKKLYDDAGLNPYTVRTEEDWAKVPIVTKQMIADHSREFEVDGLIEKYGFAAHTGGSTGKPLRVFRDKRHFWQSPWWRFYGWHLGRKCGEPECSVPIWGLDEGSIDRSYYRSTEEWIRQRDVSFWPKKFFNLTPYAEFEDGVEKFIEDLSKSPLAQIYAYAGGLDMFTDYCIENDVHFNNVAFINTCASPLTPIIREKVKKVFGCGVFDFYGSNEMGPMAIECCKSGHEHHLHVLSDLLSLELVDDDGNLVQGEEMGSTIITCFTNKVFPFIRYNHGDRTHFIQKSCECDLPFPCIAPVRGRITEYLATKDGVRLDGVGFNEAFDFFPEAVNAFQFRQKTDGYATLVVVPNEKYTNSNEEINLVLTKLNNDFAGKIVFTLQSVKSIKYDGGKMRYIVHE